VITRLDSELRDSTAARQVAVRQWEGAVEAMGRRDKALQDLATRHQQSEARATALAAEAAGAEAAAAREEGERERLEIERRRFMAQLGTVESRAAALERRAADAEMASASVGAVAQRVVGELDATLPELERVTKERDRLRERVGALETELGAAREAVLRETEVARKVAERAERAGARAEKGAQDEVEALRLNLADADAEKSKLRIAEALLRAECAALQGQVDVVNKSHHGLRDAYENVHAETCELLRRLQHKERDANALRAKLMDAEGRSERDGRDNLAVLTNTVRTLETRLAEVQDAHDEMRARWLESQRDLVRSEDRCAALEEKLSTERARLHAETGASSRTARDAEASDRAARSATVELETMRVTLTKFNYEIAVLRTREHDLKTKLDEAALTLAGQRDTYEGIVGRLKVEAAALQRLVCKFFSWRLFVCVFLFFLFRTPFLFFKQAPHFFDFFFTFFSPPGRMCALAALRTRPSNRPR
jgi:chromosome segregation ATPase